jgi:Flp pilus assembly protein TadD
MTHALSKGIQAHRDVKPQNCLITQDNTLKVTDFGLAKTFDAAGTAEGEKGRRGEGEKGRSELLGRLFGRRREGEAPAEPTPNVQGLSIGLTRTGTAAGTCSHMAPEQFDDAKHVDVRADIYSFGVMLFQMVTGRLPFIGRTWQEFERLHKTQPVPPLTINHQPLTIVVHTCLAKAPADRFADFGAVRERLAEVYENLTGAPAPQPVRGEELSVVAWSNKGGALRALGRTEEALDCYDRALALNPRDEQAWYNKGVALGALGRTEEALDCYDRALALNPRYEQAWSNKGVALGALGRTEEALDCYDRALALNPRYEQAWSNKGVALGALGRTEEELDCYDRALALNPRDEKAWFNKGAVLFNDFQRYREALACFEKAQRLGYPQAAQGIALCRQRLGE